MNEEKFSENESNRVDPYEDQQEDFDKEQYARTLTQHGIFKDTYKQLEEEGLLSEQVERVKDLFSVELEGVDFLSSHDWELLTVINLYSPELAVHSVETYLLVRSKIEHIHVGSETLAQTITGEGVSLDEFYRASLLHDIGKTYIPESVLDNTLSRSDWKEFLRLSLENDSDGKVLERCGLSGIDELDSESIESIMSNHDIHPDYVLPVRQVFTESEIQELERRGISPDLTFREILQLHEPASQDILEKEGLMIEAQIAGQHHNYKHTEYHFPISSQTVGVGADFTDLLHLADVEQALLSERSYKPTLPKLTVLDILVQQAESGQINKKLTALWVENEWSEDLVEEEFPDGDKKIEHIQTFIQQYSSIEEI